MKSQVLQNKGTNSPNANTTDETNETPHIRSNSRFGPGSLKVVSNTNSLISPVRNTKEEIVKSPENSDTKDVVPIIKKNNNLLTNINDVDKKSDFKERNVYSDNVEIKFEAVKNDTKQTNLKVSKEFENLKNLIQEE